MKIFCHYVGLIWQKNLISLYKELFRKTIHICAAFVPLMMRFSFKGTIILLLLAVIFYSICEVLSLHGKRVPVISTVIDIAARTRDKNKFALGPVTLVFGIVITSLLWDRTSACIGIYALAFGDGSASLAGKLFGRLNIPFTNGKTCAGSLVCMIAIFCSTFIVSKNALLSLVIAVAGMVIEILPLKDFDNLVIPIALGGISSFMCNTL